MATRPADSGHPEAITRRNRATGAQALGGRVGGKAMWARGDVKPWSSKASARLPKTHEAADSRPVKAPALDSIRRRFVSAIRFTE